MMLSLGPLAFAAPWALGAITILPVLWWLLRVTPPSPRRMSFPAVRLLFGLDASEDASARTPWWVLALRLLIAFLIILAVAHPLINPAKPLASTSGPLVIAIDDGWASARDWSRMRAHVIEALANAGRAGRPVILLPTAPPADGSRVAASNQMSADDARVLVQALEPKPWSPDRQAAAAAVAQLPRDRTMQSLWLSDGLDASDGSGGAAENLARALQSLGGGLEIVTGRTGRVLLPPVTEPGDRMSVSLRRLTGLEHSERVAIRALDGQGRVLGREEAMIAPGQDRANVVLRLPADIRNRLVRLDVEGEQGAAATVLLDERWRRRPVGIAGGGDTAATPLLGELYYVERALEPHADLHRGDLADLLDRDLAALVVADVPAVLGETADRLESWVEEGGVLVRFAGPALANAATENARYDDADPFLPVRLRDGGRILGGAMSWGSAQELAAFPPESPFAGLIVPSDISVRAQVLAEPTLELAEQSWARLADGTPLVTGARKGKGWLVLIHTTANAEWSNLALSGLFPEMLRRLVGLSEGMPAMAAKGALPPAEIMDGFGRLEPPSGAVTALADPALKRVSPRNPPGLYGAGGTRVAVNLGPLIGEPALVRAPTGVRLSQLGSSGTEIDLRPALLAAALALAILDLAIALGLRGLLWRGAAAMIVLGLVTVPPAKADPFALEAALETRLAYVRVGDDSVDRISKAGLSRLSKVVADRSTAALGEPMAVDLEADPVLFFPLLYWPVTGQQSPPSAKAVEKLNDYIRRGGLIVFDTGPNGPDADPAKVQALARDLALPPLMPVGEEHVLTRSFYLLRELPGRFDAGPVWVEDGRGIDNDGVSPVVVGGNYWAGAWAVDEAGKPMFAVLPGGERQRELAYRFGINLVMYALTGNYKADQVHLPAIIERLGQ